MKHPLPEFQPDAATAARLVIYRDLLLQWTGRINLIAERDAGLVDRRHVADSVQLAPLLPATGPIADLGSGAGLPGLILAATDPAREVHLVESDRRKSAFLIEASRAMGLPAVRVHPCRIESASLPPLAALTARALAPLARLIPYAVQFLAPDGVAIFPKGRNAAQELTEAAPHWHMEVEPFASRTDPEATIFRLSHIRHAGI